MEPPGNSSDGTGMPAGVSSQAWFHCRWDHLHDPHVRSLAWLLDAPDLLDAGAPQWGGRIARLQIDFDQVPDCHVAHGVGGASSVAGVSSVVSVGAWLAGLDAQPALLHAWLGLAGTPRLGRHAEKLLAFYFTWRGDLVAHGLQVRTALPTKNAFDCAVKTAGVSAGSETVGEFDFLLKDGPSLRHLELATKFYLFEAAGMEPGQDFIGPNLADTLAAKMDKILHRQLALSQHPAARAILPQPVGRAQALIKGWLFYPAQDASAADSPGFQSIASQGASGVAARHCRGRWCSVGEFPSLDAPGFLRLPRLAWLAPARSEGADVLNGTAMQGHLQTHFTTDTMPVLVAMMMQQGGVWRESDRCFVVPDDWRQRVHERNQRSMLRREQGA